MSVVWLGMFFTYIQVGARVMWGHLYCGIGQIISVSWKEMWSKPFSLEVVGGGSVLSD